LLDNAVKYSKAGNTVVLSLAKNADKAIIKVQDQGIGIPEADHTALFEPFRRASNVGEVNGSGLGLSIVKEAVELHSGTITFETKLGEGTTFVITLPAG
jgi:signal transduction histidine kinase